MPFSRHRWSEEDPHFRLRIDWRPLLLRKNSQDAESLDLADFRAWPLTMYIFMRHQASKVGSSSRCSTRTSILFISNCEVMCPPTNQTFHWLAKKNRFDVWGSFFGLSLTSTSWGWAAPKHNRKNDIFPQIQELGCYYSTQVIAAFKTCWNLLPGGGASN